MKHKSPEINRGFYGFDYSINIFDLLILIDLVNDTIWLAHKDIVHFLIIIHVGLNILYKIIEVYCCLKNV